MVYKHKDPSLESTVSLSQMCTIMEGEVGAVQKGLKKRKKKRERTKKDW